MSVITWGSLPKSQDDNETVEQAIARLITAHLADANAHIEAGESLYVHKQSETIDHLADSIVEDKILDQSIAVHKFKYDKLKIETVFETIDAWTEYVSGSGVVENYIASTRLRTSTTINSIADIHADAWLEGYGERSDHNPLFATETIFKSTTNQEAYIVAGSYDWQGFGFKIIDDTLYTLSIKDGAETTTDISAGITLTDWHRLKAIYTSGSKIEFYVDDILKATHSTNLPENSSGATDELTYFRYRIKNTAAENKEIHLRYLSFVQDK